MKKNILETIVFVSGMSVMIFELVGARILAPFFGTSIIVWSGLIGVILACLSAGYWWGGRVADKRPDFRSFSSVILLAAFFIGLTGSFKLPVLNFLQGNIKDIRLVTILSSLLLFGPGSFFLAAVSPYAARLKIVDLKQSGETIGNLSAVATAGSIVGTFLTGFVLIVYIGNTKILFLLSSSLLLCSMLAYRKRWMKAKIAAVAILVAGYFFSNNINNLFLPKGTIYISGQYSDIIVKKDFARYGDGSQRPILELATDPDAIQSAKFLDGDNELVLPYLKAFRLADHFNPNISKALMIGGGAYSFPQDILARDSQVTMDVVEMDPKVTETAKRYFGLADDPRLKVYPEDGRVFLETNQNKYDAVFVDAYQSSFVPYQLTTKEAAGHIFRSLNNNGVVLMNIISSIEGNTGKFLRAEYATYKKVFPQVYVIRLSSPDPREPQNLTLVALKSDKVPAFSSDNAEQDNFLSHVWDGKIEDDMPVLTDDFAPVSQYLLPVYAYNRSNR